MKSNKYWEERANLRMESYHKDSDKVVAKINKAYDKALEDINEDIDHIFNTYVSKHDLIPEKARELLNEAADPEIVIERYKEILSKVQDDTIKKRILARLNKEAYKARITRLEALKESIRDNMYKVADTELAVSTKGYLDTIDSAYYHNMYDLQKGLSLGFDFAPLDDKGIQEILKQNWSGKHYSERVWGNTQVLSSKLEDIVTKGMLTGKSNRQMTNELMDMTNSGKLAAERLVRTETTYVANAAEMESYKEAEVDKYVFVATLDSRTSKVCREHDGKVYKVSEGVPGENMPPLHPFCRSTTIAYDGEETLARMQRRARVPVTGKTYTVPANMNYEEWRKQYVEGKYGKAKADALDKMVKNKASDRKQFERYKETLGKDAPKSLKDFQELKYNNNEAWDELKSDYRYKNMLNKREIVNGERSLPFESTPNSISDLMDATGNVKQRRVYNGDGKADVDIDTSDHGKPKYHPMGAHKHKYDYGKGTPHGEADYFTERELRQNNDIVEEGKNYKDDRDK